MRGRGRRGFAHIHPLGLSLCKGNKVVVAGWPQENGGRREAASSKKKALSAAGRVVLAEEGSFPRQRLQVRFRDVKGH